MIAAAATTAAGAGPSAAPATVPPYDAWTVVTGATEPRGSHHTVDDALAAGAVVTHGRAVVAVARGTTDAALDRVLRDVLRVDLPALRRRFDEALDVRAVVDLWCGHVDELERMGERARTGVWLRAYAHASALNGHLTAAELRRRIAARVSHPAVQA